MTNQEKLTMLEEMMELDADSLQEDTVLADLAEWNSMARLSFIVLMDEEFKKKVSAAQIRSFAQVKDILAVME